MKRICWSIFIGSSTLILGWAAPVAPSPAPTFIGAREPAKSVKPSPLTPGEERQSFTLPPGFEIELVDSESEGVGKFVTVDWDTHGRMWSMTALEYPVDANENPELATKLYASKARDKILVWDNPYGPGPHSPRIFAEGLAIPLGILPYKNGVYVQHGTEIVFLSDTNSDGKADRREVILSGFGVQDSHLFPHQFTRAPGNWIWMAQGAFNYGKVRTTTGKEQQFDRTRMARFRYDGSDFEITSQGPCNIWGLVLTGEGEAWIQEANDYGYPAMPFHLYANYPGCSDAEFKSYAPEFPGTAPDFSMGGTGLSGLALSDKAVWSDPYADVMYVANPITRKVQAIKIHREGPRYKLEKLPDFLQSSDDMFRPVSIHFGPDGCLYVVDWYNKIISHNEVPRNHPDRDKTRGRIWRVKQTRQKLLPVPDFTRISGDNLLAKLGGESLAQSHLAWQAITDRQLIGLKPKLKSMAGNRSQPAAKRIAALWALEGLGAASDLKLLRPLLADTNRNIRREAIRVAGALPLLPNEWSADGPGVFDSLHPLSEDSDPQVRAEVIKTTARLLAALETSSDPKASRLIAQVALPALLIMARPALAGPTTRSTQSGRIIKAGEAYEREFERYLVRLFLEQHAGTVSRFLDGRAGDSTLLPVESRVLALLAVGTKEGAVHLARLVPRLQRDLSEEEIVLLGTFATEPAVHQCLSEVLDRPATQAITLECLLKARARLQNSNLPSMVAGPARTLIARDPSPYARDLFLRLAAAFRLSELEPEIAGLTTQENQTPERQILGIKALAELGTSRVELFQRMAINGKSEVLHQEAVAALASSKNERAFSLLIEIWPVLTPKLRKVSLDRLTISARTSRALLEAIQRGEISTEDLDGYAIDKLKAVLGNNPDLAALEQDLAARRTASSETDDLKKKIETIREYASRPGSVEKGKAVFTTTCLICHTVHGEGRNLGPTLNGAGAMDSESLLRSIVTPGAAIESGYYRFRVETKEGEITDGLFVSQNENEIVLRPITGEDVHLSRGAVKRAGFTKTSLMPDGLVDALPPEEVANLFAYLRTLK